MTSVVLWLWLAGVVLAVAFRLVLAVKSRRRAAPNRARPTPPDGHRGP